MQGIEPAPRLALMSWELLEGPDRVSFLILSTPGMHIIGILILVIHESKALALVSSRHPRFDSSKVTAIQEQFSLTTMLVQATPSLFIAIFCPQPLGILT